MTVLAIETATLSGSVAIGRIAGNLSEVHFSKQWLRQRSHGELLTASLEEAFTVTGIAAKDIDLLCLDVGPGSFTGVRVGLATMKALGYGLNKPILAFSSLQILAEQVPLIQAKMPLICLLNAHKSQMYAAKFIVGSRGWRNSLRPQAIDQETLQKWVTGKSLCVGEGYKTFAESFGPRLKSRLVRALELMDYPSATTMVRLAAKGSWQKKTISWDQLEALYIRGSEAEEKLKAGVLKPLPSF